MTVKPNYLRQKRGNVRSVFLSNVVKGIKTHLVITAQIFCLLGSCASAASEQQTANPPVIPFSTEAQALLENAHQSYLTGDFETYLASMIELIDTHGSDMSFTSFLNVLDMFVNDCLFQLQLNCGNLALEFYLNNIKDEVTSGSATYDEYYATEVADNKYVYRLWHDLIGAENDEVIERILEPKHMFQTTSLRSKYLLHRLRLSAAIALNRKSEIEASIDRVTGILLSLTDSGLSKRELMREYLSVILMNQRHEPAKAKALLELGYSNLINAFPTGSSERQTLIALSVDLMDDRFLKRNKIESLLRSELSKKGLVLNSRMRELRILSQLCSRLGNRQCAMRLFKNPF